jgi:hypothetical protein
MATANAGVRIHCLMYVLRVGKHMDVCNRFKRMRKSKSDCVSDPDIAAVEIDDAQSLKIMG